ncbi:MAG: alcohol dehydrogenase catalytic domain-containing protein [Planctomycetota bacterium]|jgi:L-iditol 2-dehydrogenase
MKGVLLTGIEQIEIQEIPDPEIKNDTDVLIKMQIVGLCGSDVHYYANGKIGSQVVTYPYPVGHEGAGVVEKVGAGVTNVKPGDRVAIEPAMSCHICDQCKAGRPHTCRKLRFLGCPKQAEGCLTEYLVMPQECCFKIPDSMSYEEAAISEPLAIGVYGVQQSVDMKDKTIGILGAGPIGLSVLMPAVAQGVKKAYVTDKIDERLKIAEKSGAGWTGNPDKEDIAKKITAEEPELLDVVFECCGQQEAADQAVEILKPGGKIMIIGIPPTLDKWSFEVDQMRHKEICIQNVRRQNHCVQKALDMITNKDFDVNVMVTHHFKLEESKEAFDLVKDYKDGVVKAMIHFD